MRTLETRRIGRSALCWDYHGSEIAFSNRASPNISQVLCGMEISVPAATATLLRMANRSTTGSARFFHCFKKNKKTLALPSLTVY